MRFYSLTNRLAARLAPPGICDLDRRILAEADRPLLFHKPHGGPSDGMTWEAASSFQRLTRHVLARDNGGWDEPSEAVLFATYSNYAQPTLLETCLRSYGIDDCVVLGKEVTAWSWWVKIDALQSYLAARVSLPPYIVVADATDTLLIRPPTDIIERFEAYGCDILFCNTCVSWPPDEACEAFERNVCSEAPHRCHLSAGGLMAHTQRLAPYLEEIGEAYHANAPWLTFRGEFDDQSAWKWLYRRHHPRIRVDHRGDIFERYDRYRGRIINETGA